MQLLFWELKAGSTRYDVGDKQGYLEATVEFALRRPDLRDEFLNYLQNIVEKETISVLLNEAAVTGDK